MGRIEKFEKKEKQKIYRDERPEQNEKKVPRLLCLTDHLP